VIRDLREQAQMTRMELAKKAKVTTAYVSMIEAGRRQSPSLAVLRRLARALGVPVGELLE
jgi:transcriptional regulator with XRE-family HTH domain